MPTWTAVAPSVSAAATPRPSAIPPAAMIGTSRWSANRGSSAKSRRRPFGGVGVEAAAMAACLHALGDDRVGAGVLGGERLVESGGAGEPGDAVGVQART